MIRLAGGELRRLSKFFRELYQLRTHEEFTDHVISAIPNIVGGQFTSYNEFYEKSRPGFFKCDQTPHCTDPAYYAAVLGRYIHQHPVIMHFHQKQIESTRMVTDFVSMRTFRSTDLYNEFYKPLKIPYLLSMAINVSPQLIITVSRHRDGREFSEAHRSTFNAIRPHLRQALQSALSVTRMQNHLAAANEVIKETRHAFISVTKEGRVRFATTHAQQLLKSYGLQIRGTDWLPPVIKNWLIYYLKQLDRIDDVPPAIQPLIVKNELNRLCIRMISQGSHNFLVLDEQRPATFKADFAVLGLSPRESEILGWVAQGKTNPEIGIILSISHRTVHKHLERIYYRLGVENRTAATAVALSASFTSS